VGGDKKQRAAALYVDVACSACVFRCCESESTKKI